MPTLLSNEVGQPCWLDDRDITGPVVATTNGLLDISTRTLHPHSPMFFNVTSVPFAYNSGAPKPQKWLDFLDALWPKEPTPSPFWASGLAMSFPGGSICTKFC